MRIKKAALATTVGVLTLGAAAIGGVAMAQTPGPGAPASGTPSAAQQQRQVQRQAQENQYLNDLAKNLGIDRSKLDAALKATRLQEVDAAVTAGTLTQAEANQLKQTAQSSMSPMGPGPGFGGDFTRGFAGLQITGLQDAIDKAFQQTVGETRQQFMQELQGGKLPDAVFKAHNTTAQAVGQAEAAAAKPILDQAVQQKLITQAQETAFLQQLQNGPGFGPGRGPGGPGGPGGPPPPAASNATDSTTTATQ